ncbi:epoxide hydrolase [Monoraphidium neglectum]|uniref:Epoxide hydrolase n=1 Tax=Monoraphidium neglectum TaxID=145388 RepID=A0A0D2LJA2_9CHLO|nr:epoxide hydrolase [Monoraphidium neglectum]KIY92064.1 epoxide hydrolase [Monoraphidium neglectum]|eukprot:XP_013891084.1 epoxide hydrolase [Monoraphidium neglectum]
MRLYKETFSNQKEMGAVFGGYSSTPCAVALFPKELYRPPRSWAASAYNIVQWTEMPKGGHFAALEQPELLVADVLKFADLAQTKGWI